MKNVVEEWLLNLGEIIELQDCMCDVLRNNMEKCESSGYTYTFMKTIREKSENLYELIDDTSLSLTNIK